MAHLQGFVDLLGGPQLDDEESSPPIWMSTFFSSCLGQSSQELYTNALEKDEKTVSVFSHCRSGSHLIIYTTAI